MSINPSVFLAHNIIDTCAVWHVISSSLLFQRCDSSGVLFYCTDFVIYECLRKHRTNPTPEQLYLMKSFCDLRSNGKFTRVSISVEDLHDIDKMGLRKRVGKGELSSLAFAYKVKQAFMTDDQGARKLALSFLPKEFVQTTPHLFSWLIFCSRISDAEVDNIIAEHEKNGGQISRHLRDGYKMACMCRCNLSRPS